MIHDKCNLPPNELVSIEYKTKWEGGRRTGIFFGFSVRTYLRISFLTCNVGALTLPSPLFLMENFISCNLLSHLSSVIAGLC